MPGAGYDSAACAGSFEVLTVLAKKGLVKLKDFMGASGGACSALLALADPEESSRRRQMDFAIGWTMEFAKTFWEKNIFI